MTTIVYKLYRPASVKLPDGQIHHRTVTYITSDGVKVFTAPSDIPLFESEVDFTKVPEPRRSRAHVGIDIETAAGLVVITPTGGCESCGGKLRGWAPAWATNVSHWPTR